MFDKRARLLYYNMSGDGQITSKKVIDRKNAIKNYFKETDLFCLSMDEIRERIAKIKQGEDALLESDTEISIDF